MNLQEKRELRAKAIDLEIAHCFKTYGVLTATYIAKQLEVTRQQVSFRLRLLAEKGEAHVACTPSGSVKFQVWAEGQLTEGAEPELRLKLQNLLARNYLQIPDTPHRTTFVGGTNPWENANIKNI